jgi:hypothetical protein
MFRQIHECMRLVVSRVFSARILQFVDLHKPIKATDIRKKKKKKLAKKKKKKGSAVVCPMHIKSKW